MQNFIRITLLEGVGILHEQLNTFTRTQLSLDTNTVQTPGTDLGGNLAKVHGHQNHGNIGPDRFATQTSHTRVQVLEQSRMDVFWTDLDISGHQVNSSQLHQC